MKEKELTAITDPHYWDGYTRDHVPDCQCCDCLIRGECPVGLTDVFGSNFVKCRDIRLREGAKREKHWPEAYCILSVEKDLGENADLFTEEVVAEARAMISRLRKEQAEK